MTEETLWPGLTAHSALNFLVIHPKAKREIKLGKNARERTFLLVFYESSKTGAISEVRSRNLIVE